MAGMPGSPFDVVALVTSAGGLAALRQVLLPLPDDFNAALVVVQHLGGPASSLAEILGRRSPLPVHWIADHDLLKPGHVYVCPPQRLLTIMPDAECSVRPMEPEHRLRPIDFFLASLAHRYGRRAMVVVLTGMGGDSAAGSEAVSHASGTVLVQSPESAEHPMMPSAVIGVGVADMVLPLSELGRMIAGVVAGGASYRAFLLLVAGQAEAADRAEPSRMVILVSGAAASPEADMSVVQVNAGQLRIRAERRDRICVMALSGPLDMAASARLTECVRAERAARPARLVIDMSGVSFVDFGGARALAAAASPVPGQCPVIVRSVRPAARRQLELTGLDLGGLDRDTDPAGARPPGRDSLLADSATGILVRERRHLLGWAEHAIADSYRTAQSLASAEDHIAATLLRLAARRPAASARLEALSQTARSYADTLRDRKRPETGPGSVAPAALPSAVSGTVGCAVAFIEERARDDIGVADIAAAAFVTVRAVQLAFRRYLGTTPLGYLRQIRLERAHEQLLTADPDRTTVTAVAADWHFTNPSRFTAYYRAAYGVPPARTLRQRHAGG